MPGANNSYATASDIAKGGATPYRNLSLGVTGQVVKSTPGRLYGGHVYNAAASARFLKFYNKATAPSEADTPVLTIGVPATSLVALPFPSCGVGFSAGLSVRASTGVADADTGAPSANDVVLNLLYA